MMWEFLKGNTKFALRHVLDSEEIDGEFQLGTRTTCKGIDRIE